MTLTTPKKGQHVPDDWQARFLLALRRYGNVSYAAKRAGVSRGYVYEQRNTDPGFAVQWADALDEAADVMEKEAWRRAVTGTRKPVYQGGKLAGLVQEYSDTLLIFLLKGARPDKYRERVDYNQSGASTIRVVYQDDDTGTA